MHRPSDVFTVLGGVQLGRRRRGGLSSRQLLTYLQLVSVGDAAVRAPNEIA